MRSNELADKRPVWRRAAMMLAATGTLAIGAGAATAAPPLLFAGASVAERGERYEYLGLASAFLPAQYLTQRLMLSDYQYGYQSAGTDVVVRGHAVEAALGIKSASEAGWIEASAGLRYRHNEVHPPGVDVRAEGHRFGLVLGVQGEWQFAQRWAFNGIGTYAIGPASFWARGRLLRRIAGSVSLGLEAVGHGDPDYRAVQGGVVLTGIKVTETLKLGVYSGVKKTSGQARSFYGGLELSKAF
ncbi:cellulose biosynthesis protein BcsS [Cupriavidus sp. BIC8F]|uniref:cellulose biosynthesis protein BcsS n=1 Tax=Cupriavidus sp. BIC8F TaxID=3079014 RepID=UPI00291630A6|nr:cellulose biosynthesis protein BcsS [Cupriavidus sp. BIC8F]